MRKLTVYSLTLLLFAIFSCDSEREEELISKSISAANDYINALKNNNTDELIGFYPEILIESYGEETLRKELEDGYDLLFDNGLSYGEFKCTPPENFIIKGDAVHSLIQVNIKMYSPEGAFISTSYIYCLSQDSGESWTVMEYDALKKTFPDFKFQFNPSKKKQSQEIDCQYYMLDIFAYDVCIDRYIESGDYIVKEKGDKYVYQIVKSISSTQFASNRLELISISLSELSRTNDIIFKFPNIKTSNVYYLESHIGRFYLYDIYGIPFKYWYKTNPQEIFTDTLRGYFKNDNIKASNPMEHIKKLRVDDDQFIIQQSVEEFTK